MTTENQYAPKVIGERSRWPAIQQDWPNQEPTGDVPPLGGGFINNVRRVDVDPAEDHRAKAVGMVIVSADEAAEILSHLRSWLHSISDDRRDSWIDEAIKRLDELSGHYEQERAR